MKPGTRVNTPEGPGVIMFIRMAPPDFDTVQAISVYLDNQRHNPMYNATVFKAEQVSVVEPLEQVRIKPGVRPYGGRLVQLVKRLTYPNGRKVVRILAPLGGTHVDVREYNADEIVGEPPGTDEKCK